MGPPAPPLPDRPGLCLCHAPADALTPPPLALGPPAPASSRRAGSACPRERCHGPVRVCQGSEAQTDSAMTRLYFRPRQSRGRAPSTQCPSQRAERHHAGFPVPSVRLGLVRRSAKGRVRPPGTIAGPSPSLTVGGVFSLQPVKYLLSLSLHWALWRG